MTPPDRILEAVRALTARCGPPSSSDVAAQLDLTPQHVNRTLETLIAGNLVRRIGKGPAARLLLVRELSPDVQAQVNAMRALSVAQRAAVFAALQEVAHA